MEGFANMMEENLEKEKNIKNQINDHEQSLHQSQKMATLKQNFERISNQLPQSLKAKLLFQQPEQSLELIQSQRSLQNPSASHLLTVLLAKLKSRSKQKSINEKLDIYVKLEANKKASISTVQKLIKLTKEKRQCFLCKSEVDQTQMTKIEQTFKPDLSQYDQKIAAAKQELMEEIQVKDQVAQNVIDEVIAEMEENEGLQGDNGYQLEDILRQSMVLHQNLPTVPSLQKKIANLEQNLIRIKNSNQNSEQQKCRLQEKLCEFERQFEQDKSLLI